MKSFIIGVSTVCLLFIAGCSELKQNNPSAATPAFNVHDQGWNDTASSSFHGRVLQAKGYVTTDCQPCHAKLLTGGTSGKGCQDCHTIYPHDGGWMTITSAKFHGLWKLDSCKSCHGADFSGGTSQVGCRNCHTQYPHPAGWMITANAGFHGQILSASQWKTDSCTACHGSDLAGGISQVGCRNCHTTYPHLTGWTTTGSANFHGKTVAGYKWEMDSCKTCHGTDYAGGTSGISCALSGCHVSRTGVAKTPEMCNTCHGDFLGEPTDIPSWAPPRDLAGDISTTIRGVGAHQGHLAGLLGKTVKCQECHLVPATLYAAGHLDSNPPAEVALNDTLANLTTGGGTHTAHGVYNATTGSCATSYCHGNWVLRKATSPSPGMFIDTVIVGNAFAPKWTNGAADGACGTCHDIPPRGHLAVAVDITSCAACHGEVVDGTGKIINKSKHINGKINVGGLELNF